MRTSLYVGKIRDSNNILYLCEIWVCIVYLPINKNSYFVNKIKFLYGLYCTT